MKNKYMISIIILLSFLLAIFVNMSCAEGSIAEHVNIFEELIECDDYSVVTKSIMDLGYAHENTDRSREFYSDAPDMPYFIFANWSFSFDQGSENTTKTGLIMLEYKQEDSLFFPIIKYLEENTEKIKEFEDSTVSASLWVGNELRYTLAVFPSEDFFRLSIYKDEFYDSHRFK